MDEVLKVDGELITPGERSLQVDMLRALQQTPVDSTVYTARMANRKEQDYRFLPRPPEEGRAIRGYAEHLYILTGADPGRILHLNLTTSMPWECRVILCLPGHGLPNARSFWVVPCLEDEAYFWEQGLPEDCYDESFIIADILQNKQRTLEVQIRAGNNLESDMPQGDYFLD